MVPSRVRGRAHPPPTHKERQRRCRRDDPPARTRPRTPGERLVVAPWAYSQGEAREGTFVSGGPQRRSTRSPGGAAVTLWPSWSPVVRSAGSACRTVGEHGQRGRSGKLPSTVHPHQTPIPRWAIGAPPNTPRSPRSGPCPRRHLTRASPGSWPGPSCDSRPLRGPIASPMGWPVTPLPATGQPKPASYPAGVTGKQADARLAVRLVAAGAVSGHRHHLPLPRLVDAVDPIGGVGGRRLGRLTRWLASRWARSARRMIAHARVVGRRGWLSLCSSTTTLAPRVAYCSSRRTHWYNSAADRSRPGAH